ncbi:MAG TPA: phospholipase D-like domain-containing protein [Ktedonobacterales bacterium]
MGRLKPYYTRHWPHSATYRLCGLLLLSLLLTACDTGNTSNASVISPPSTTSAGTCLMVACAAQGVTVFVEPDAGAAPIVRAIKAAKRSIWVEVYLLSDSSVVHALEDAAARGLDVRVLLETHPFGDGAASAQHMLEQLNAAHIAAKATNPAFQYTHAKMLLLDGTTAYILTANLSASGLGGYSTTTGNREYLVLDTNPDDVADAHAIFQADWDRIAPRLHIPRLVVSPVNARVSLLGLIASARTTLDLEDEAMYDRQSEDALIAVAQRGVPVRLVLPAPSAGSPPSQSDDMARLRRGGVQVRYLTAPYMHAKLIVSDGALAFAGSENFSSTSLDQNREIGLMIADPHALAIFTHTFAQDWALAAPA